MNSPPYSSGGDHDSLPPPFRTLLLDAAAVLDQASPPSLREILAAYRTKGDGDRDMLLAMLNAKSAEDQRIAALASLRRTLLQMTQSLDERPAPPASQYNSASLPPPMTSPRPSLAPPKTAQMPYHAPSSPYPPPQQSRAPFLPTYRVPRLVPATYHSQPHTYRDGAMRIPPSAYATTSSSSQPVRKRPRHHYSPTTASPQVPPARVYPTSPVDGRLHRELPPSPYSSAGEREPSVEVMQDSTDPKSLHDNDKERGTSSGAMSIGTLLSNSSNKSEVDHDREEPKDDDRREERSRQREFRTSRSSSRHRSQAEEEESQSSKL